MYIKLSMQATLPYVPLSVYSCMYWTFTWCVPWQDAKEAGGCLWHQIPCINYLESTHVTWIHVQKGQVLSPAQLFYLTRCRSQKWPWNAARQNVSVICTVWDLCISLNSLCSSTKVLSIGMPVIVARHMLSKVTAFTENVFSFVDNGIYTCIARELLLMSDKVFYSSGHLTWWNAV